MPTSDLGENLAVPKAKHNYKLENKLDKPPLHPPNLVHLIMGTSNIFSCSALKLIFSHFFPDMHDSSCLFSALENRRLVIIVACRHKGSNACDTGVPIITFETFLVRGNDMETREVYPG